MRIAGIGEAMLEEGLESLFPISDIAVMGLIEIIPRIPLIKRRMRETISRINRSAGYCGLDRCSDFVTKYGKVCGERYSARSLCCTDGPATGPGKEIRRRTRLPDDTSTFRAAVLKKKASIQRLSAILFLRETPETALVPRSERPMISVRVRQLFPSCWGAGAVR